MTTAIQARATGIIRPLILLVDDDTAVLEALRDLLAPRLEPAYRIETAASAEEALGLVADVNGRAAEADATGEPGSGTATDSPIVLVVSDERMPGKSGTDLLIALRESRAHRHGGRIIVTAYAGLGSAKRAINEADVDGYFPKPWNTEEELLPAVSQILMRFAQASGMDQLLLCAAEDFSISRDDILDVRKAWWQYVALMGVPADEAEVDVPAFDQEGDEGADHLVARRVSPWEERALGAVRLRTTSDGAVLDSLCFRPQEASDEAEALLVRTAVLHAASRGIDALSVEVPLLRRQSYEALGFGPSPRSAAAGRVRLSIVPSAAARGPQSVFAARFGMESRLCSCSQRECVRHDYAASSRGYFCPLDVIEGRTPRGFLGAPQR